MAGRGRKAASYIPHDLCGEILYRLPSNDLRNFKLVCKDWLRLISSKEFIQKHLERSKADCNHLRIVVNFESEAQIIDCANNTSKKISSDHDERHLLGCCDGLVLYYDYYHCKIAALNPCTGESLLLVPMPKQYGIEKLRRYMLKFSWFGHHPSTGQYVVVLAYWESGSINFEVYSLSLDRNNINLLLLSSSTLDQLDVGISRYSNSNEIGTLLHGRLHCPANVINSHESGFEFVILVYDFETNKIMRMTPAIQHPIWMLGVVDGCLSAIQDEQVWIMKEYGVEECWTKYAKTDGFPLAFSPDGDFVITSDWFSTVIRKYSLREREAKILCKFMNSTTVKFAHELAATACIDSLVSPTLLSREDE